MMALLVGAGALRELDRAALGLAQTPHERSFDVLASIVSAFGNAEVAGGLALGLAVARLRARRTDWWIPLAIAATVVIESVLKLMVAQPAPPHELSRSVPILPALEVPFPYSFPSGHTARATFLAAVVRLPSWLGVLAVAVMAVTRVYLAEHWFSDVAGGVLLGYGVTVLARVRAAR